jgi:hypothetical protein
MPEPPAIQPGAYVMTWHGVDAPVWFHADGFYACRWAGRWWHGRWSQVGGVLRVTEWVMDDPAVQIEWAVTLTGPRDGSIGASPWRLAPVVEGRVR